MPIFLQIKHLPKPEGHGWKVNLALAPSGVVYDYAVIGSGTPAEIYNRIDLDLGLSLNIRLAPTSLEGWLSDHMLLLEIMLAEHEELGSWGARSEEAVLSLLEAFEKDQESLVQCWDPASFFSDPLFCLREILDSSSLYSYCAEQADRAWADAETYLDIDETVRFFEKLLAEQAKGLTHRFADHIQPGEELATTVRRLTDRGMVVDSCFTHEEWDAILFHDGQSWNLSYAPEIEDVLDCVETEGLLWAEAEQKVRYSAGLDKPEENAVHAILIGARENNRARGDQSLKRFSDALV